MILIDVTLATLQNYGSDGPKNLEKYLKAGAWAEGIADELAKEPHIGDASFRLIGKLPEATPRTYHLELVRVAVQDSTLEERLRTRLDELGNRYPF